MELTITAHTKQTTTKYFQLYIDGRKIPKNIKGGEYIIDNCEYRVKLKNTRNIDEKSPEWCKTWNHENILVDITSDEENFAIERENGRYILAVTLPNDAIAEKWYNEYDF